MLRESQWPTLNLARSLLPTHTKPQAQMPSLTWLSATLRALAQHTSQALGPAQLSMPWGHGTVQMARGPTRVTVTGERGKVSNRGGKKVQRAGGDTEALHTGSRTLP